LSETANVIDFIRKQAQLLKEPQHIAYEFDANTTVEIKSPEADSPRSKAAQFFRENRQLIIRFAYDCPFEDVRQSFQKLISFLNTIDVCFPFALFFRALFWRAFILLIFANFNVVFRCFSNAVFVIS